MKKTLLAGIAILSLAAPASAADIAPAPMYRAPVMAPAPMVFTWSGFYVGAHIGGLWSSKGWTENCFGFEGEVCAPLTDPDRGVAASDPSGFLGGVQGGFNWQTGQWVWGIEAQWSWSNGDGCGTVSINGVQGGASACTNINWVGTVAGRLGYAWDRTLLYVKGGVAFADEDHFLADNAGAFTDNPSSIRTGWMVGVGAEYAFSDQWSAKLEYNYMDFGSEHYTFLEPCNGGHCTTGIDIDQQVHVVKFGVNYRFGGPVVARY